MLGVGSGQAAGRACACGTASCSPPGWGGPRGFLACPSGRCSELLERLSSYQAPGAPAGHPGRDLGSAACQLAPPYPPRLLPGLQISHCRCLH